MTKKRRNITKELASYRVADKLASDCTERGLEVYQLPGCLIDEYAIDNSDETIKFGRALRKYAIVREYYLNEWSSGVKLILTDDEKLFQEFIQEWEQYQEEQEAV